MKKPRKDPVREDRIHEEAIVDAYGPEETAMSWYYYLEGKLSFLLAPNAVFRRSRHRSRRENRSKSFAWHRTRRVVPTCSCWFGGRVGNSPCRWRNSLRLTRTNQPKKQSVTGAIGYHKVISSDLFRFTHVRRKLTLKRRISQQGIRPLDGAAQPRR